LMETVVEEGAENSEKQQSLRTFEFTWQTKICVSIMYYTNWYSQSLDSTGMFSAISG
jgi:hypothetical protein